MDRRTSPLQRAFAAHSHVLGVGIGLLAATTLTNWHAPLLITFAVAAAVFVLVHRRVRALAGGDG